MENKFKKHFPLLGFFVLIICLIIYKWSFLNLHFFWDEAWVYGPAIIEMAKSGLSLLPSGLPEDISRGHPLLFHFTFSTIPYFFGSSVFNIHLASLIINLFMVFGFYHVIKSLTEPLFAVIATGVLSINNIFLAQLGLALPEVFLGGTIFLALYFYSINNKVFFLIFGSSALLIKESAIILPISLGLFEVVYYLANRKEIHFKDFLFKGIWIGAIGLPFLLFLMIQYLQRGYFFFPEHIGLIKFSFKYFRDTYSIIYRYLFQNQGRYLITYSFFIILCLTANKDWRLKILSWFLGFSMMKIFFRGWRLGNIGDLIVLPILFSSFFYLGIYLPLQKMERLKTIKKSEFTFLTITFIFSILYFIFSSLNFFTIRYIITLIFVFYGFIIVWIFTVPQIKVYFKYLYVGLMSIPIFVYNLNPKEAIGDTETTYKDALIVQTKLYDYITSNQLSKYTYYGNFTNEVAFQNQFSGLVSEENEIENINRFNVYKKDFIIHSNFDERIDFDTLKVELDTIKKFSSGKAKILLLKPIKSPQP